MRQSGPEEQPFLNVITGLDLTIRELAALGWQARIPMAEGLQQAVGAFPEELAVVRCGRSELTPHRTMARLAVATGQPPRHPDA